MNLNIRLTPFLWVAFVLTALTSAACGRAEEVAFSVAFGCISTVCCIAAAMRSAGGI